MKGLKSKLMAATAMLTVSAVMLVSTSFAWYTLSTNPEVKGISATAVANENLEIALDKAYTSGSEIDTESANANVGGVQGSTTNNSYTWGNTVDVSTQLAALKAELRPAAYDSKKNNAGLYTAEYAKDGRVNNNVNLTDDTYTKTDGTAGVALVKKGTGDAAVKYAFKVNYWLRTNKTGNIGLSTAVDKAKNSGLTDMMGEGSTLVVTQTSSEGTDNLANDDFGVVFKVTEDDTANATATWVVATIDKTTGAITTPDNTIIKNATPDKAYKVEMYVFLDGTKVTNADADKTGDIKVNVQFANSALKDTTTGAMKQ